MSNMRNANFGGMVVTVGNLGNICIFIANPADAKKLDAIFLKHYKTLDSKSEEAKKILHLMNQLKDCAIKAAAIKPPPRQTDFDTGK